MNLISAGYAVWHTTVSIAWPIILGLHCFGRSPRHRLGRRLCRGVYWRWVVRMFGPVIEDLFIFMAMLGAAWATNAMTDTSIGIDAAYGWLAAALVIDWITGWEDPPWRKWAAAANKLLEKLKPVPEPAINL